VREKTKAYFLNTLQLIDGKFKVEKDIFQEYEIFLFFLSKFFFKILENTIF
jgi:hypothetical protein